MNAKSRAQEFLKISSQFKLGHLVTEGFHPKTTNLSTLAQNDLKNAFEILESVDRDALEIMSQKEALLWDLAQSIQETLKSGNKVFMCGCGATGRLSLVLETLYHQKFGASDKVVSFMAGGDFALIKSVESFEDRAEFGERQLTELGFGENDLLIASTEGGETPFVIGAALKATAISIRAPYFLYCNPDEVLESIERSAKVIHHSQIRKINLTVGQMAISGSTRMQASTVLMLAIGVGLLTDHYSEEHFNEYYRDLLNFLKMTPYQVMQPLTELEAKLYQEKTHLSYIVDSDLAISVLTDTTERSPTFSLNAFENLLDPKLSPSLSYLFIENAHTPQSGWSMLLSRAPRALFWSGLDRKIDLEAVYGFDISRTGLAAREERVRSERFRISKAGERVSLKCRSEEVILNLGEDPLFTHLMLKMLLNAHSTLIMGILGRYQGNVMTWVRPSNNKLIDRAARYVMELLAVEKISRSYEEVVEVIFDEMPLASDTRPVVLRSLERLRAH